MPIQPNLIARREFASAVSGGTSNNIIYSAFEQILTQQSAFGDLLDFGGGTGNLVYRLRKFDSFQSITIADLMNSPQGIDPSVKWIRQDLNETFNLPNESFDVIVSSEVIEHLENPRAVAREWYRLLRPNGLLVVSTPNIDSIRSILSFVVQGHFVAFVESCYPSHITALNRQDIKHILHEVGFESPKFIYSDVGGIPKFPDFTWQNISGGLLRGLRFSDNILFSSRKLGNG